MFRSCFTSVASKSATPLFAYAKSVTGFPQSTFIAVLLITQSALAWMHLSVMQMMNRAAPHLQDRIEAHP
jgi:NNP family nitrate/nitrite transporter-like MFS transporter